jgi:hypothetical protein
MRLVRIALPALFVAGLAVALSRTWMDASDRAARALAVEHARSEFVQRAALVRGTAEVEWSLSLQARVASGEMRVSTATWRSKMDPQWAEAAERN